MILTTQKIPQGATNARVLSPLIVGVNVAVNRSLSGALVLDTRESIFQEAIDNVTWSVGAVGYSYLDYENQKILDSIISKGRRLELFIDNDLSVMKSLLYFGAKRFREHNEYIRNQPRRDAQKFIGNRKIRAWLFARDKCCLRCGSIDNLSVDHIESVNRGGKNQLMNLQTLCSGCNSWKSDKHIDYR
jgi:hypothetical protein